MRRRGSVNGPRTTATRSPAGDGCTGTSSRPTGTPRSSRWRGRAGNSAPAPRCTHAPSGGCSPSGEQPPEVVLRCVASTPQSARSVPHV
ncbi:hypothetical protein ACFFX0_17725 [Citricoccus parietis]|uniref:Uncharacterized protein n=1 Tax=Citricoccus parietis TaxID=592307 RepID=A0ABV5G1X7_9MICC